MQRSRNKSEREERRSNAYRILVAKFEGPAIPLKMCSDKLKRIFCTLWPTVLAIYPKWRCLRRRTHRRRMGIQCRAVGNLEAVQGEERFRWYWCFRTCSERHYNNACMKNTFRAGGRLRSWYCCRNQKSHQVTLGNLLKRIILTILWKWKKAFQLWSFASAKENRRRMEFGQSSRMSRRRPRKSGVVFDSVTIDIKTRLTGYRRSTTQYTDSWLSMQDFTKLPE